MRYLLLTTFFILGAMLSLLSCKPLYLNIADTGAYEVRADHRLVGSGLSRSQAEALRELLFARYHIQNIEIRSL